MLEKFTSISDSRTNLTEGDAMKVAQILEASPNEVYIVDRTTLTIEYANPRATRNLGYSLETLQKMTVFDIATDLNAVDFNELVTPLINHEVTQMNLETIHRRADGSIYPIEVYLQLVEKAEKLSFFAIIIDITERKNVEQSLQDKSKELANVANNIPGAIYRLHYFGDGTIDVEYVSDRAAEILEVSLSDLYADFNHFINLVHEADRDRFSLFLQNGFTDLTPSCWEGRLVTPSQGLIWIQVCSQAQQQSDGSVMRYGVLLDITAQKQAELALQESEEKFRQFAENIDDIFWMIDPHLKQLFYVSPAYEKIWGYPPDAVLENPLNFLQRIHPDDRPTVEKVISQPILEKHDTEYRIIRSDGEIRWLRDRAFPIKNQAGEIDRVAGIAQDITEEKQAQAEIHHNRELKEVIFDEATDALFLINPETFTIVDCNRRAVELSQAESKEQLLHQPADYLYKKTLSQVKQLIQEEGTWTEEIIIRTLHGQEFWGDVAWTEIQVNQTSMYLVRVTDISDQKAFEAELKTTNECLELTNQELERATKLKDEFLASMSHEIRTPLNAILGMSEALKEGAFAAINEQQQQAVKTIDTSARHLLALINDILDLAKIQSGTATLNFEQVNIKALCESSFTFISQLASRKGIDLKIQINTAANRLNTDELRMRQILINLLSNAVKFTDKGGKVTLTVTEDYYRENILFNVSDTGIGIPQNEIPQLFEPFVQLNSEFNRNHGGTGLGLSLVRRITELLGGSIGVESEVGKGSTFSVKLPYTDVYCISGEVSGEVSSHLSDQQLNQIYPSSPILVANSDQPTLDTTCSYFEASGYEVLAINTMEHLFSTLSAVTPQIIIIDLSSFEVTAESIIPSLRQITELEKTPIFLLITQIESVEIEEKLGAFEASYYLVKPIRLRNLLNQVQKHLIEEFQW
ncbi:PAS/PAC sensor hybrid histidine kinase [Halothece sp. PCC 7418]|uniref:PAS domain S-box protein n=1 Tax=Halothece sp. (strain PCC 7418) TaxID=65093 RepID=UPI0002A06E0F|nr:PAS domain S-box protein [Halothece sp. PCC 7418]AFZ44375.1 PAS/PAC sensor hybrid histidine kinase [Halothece sp. PCC 7418]